MSQSVCRKPIAKFDAVRGCSVVSPGDVLAVTNEKAGNPQQTDRGGYQNENILQWRSSTDAQKPFCGQLISPAHPADQEAAQPVLNSELIDGGGNEPHEALENDRIDHGHNHGSIGKQNGHEREQCSVSHAAKQNQDHGHSPKLTDLYHRDELTRD